MAANRLNESKKLRMCYAPRRRSSDTCGGTPDPRDKVIQAKYEELF
jgi:hypothetical protein